jgi:hypothetical protein
MPGGDLTAGLSMSKSEGCSNCTFSINAANSVSTVDIVRMPDSDATYGNRIHILPIIPFQVTFNGSVYSIPRLEWQYPSPLRVEGQLADGVLACIGETITIYIPLSSTRNFAGTVGGAPPSGSTNFFASISPRLGELSVERGKVFGSRKSIEGISVGQNWSLSQLVPADAPFFTWVQSEYQQYTKYAIPCGETRIGYRETPGPRVIFIKTPAVIADNDMAALQSTVGRIDPAKVIRSLPHVYYYPPNAPCPAGRCPAKKKQETSSSTGAFMKVAIAGGVLIGLCFIAILIPLIFERYGWFTQTAAKLKSASTLTILFVIFLVLILFGFIAAGIIAGTK